jgi:hypothetical protein
MANVVTVRGGVMDISALTEDWDLSDQISVDEGIYIKRIKYTGTAGDSVIVRHGAADGPVMSYIKTIDGSSMSDIIEMDNCIPFINNAEKTMSAGAHLMILGRSAKEF